MDNDEQTVRTMLRILGIAARFASEPETVDAFVEWAKKNHDKLQKGKCTDPLCAFHGGSKEWQRLLRQAYEMVGDMLM